MWKTQIRIEEKFLTLKLHSTRRVSYNEEPKLWKILTETVLVHVETSSFVVKCLVKITFFAL